jgi:DNA helicase-2/ATP-dependent DNA helicase PcrA
MGQCSGATIYMSQLIENLNPAQQRAVMAVDGPVLVLAGPGSGKTRVLTHRVAYLIQELGVPPWQVMAVTFTNKAANEMRERLAVLLGDTDLRRLTIGTFHAICVRILRREGETIGLDPRFVIYDTSDQLSLVKQAIQALNLSDKQYRPRSMLNLISRAKTNLLRPADFEPRTYREEVAGRIYARYQALLAENNALDFDDLLMRVVFAFREDQDLLHKYQRRYRQILVDEFQDTNEVQYELVRQMSGHHRCLFVVGDEDQSIYAFRGANFQNVLRFERDYPDTLKILLERNYRSTQTILDVANAVISPNTQRTPKTLFTRRAKGKLPVVHEAYDENQEGRWVVEQIQRLVDQGVAPGECAIMYRINAQSRAIEDAFVSEGMPYKLVGATRFYARREIKDLIAYLRIVHNPFDTVSLMRVINVPPRKIGAKSRAALVDWAAANGLPFVEAFDRLARSGDAPLSGMRVSSVGRKALLRFYELWQGWLALREQVAVHDLLDDVIEKSGFERYLRDGSEEGEERWENVLELRAVAAEYAMIPGLEGLTDFLENVALVSEVDNLDSSDAPTLLTLHAAKGLEFGTVFIVGLNDGMLPHSRAFEEPDELEEERRLFYVGVTRAEDQLYLSHVFRRTIFGSSDLSEPSRFLADIPARLKGSVAGRGSTRGRGMQAQMNLGRARSRSPSSARGSSSFAGRSSVAGRRPAADASLPRGGARPSDRSGARSGSTRSSGRPAPRRGEVVPFETGDAVRHPSFGEGTVITVAQRGGDWDVTVAFKGRGIKTLALSYAKLEKA